MLLLNSHVMLFKFSIQKAYSTRRAVKAFAVICESCFVGALATLGDTGGVTGIGSVAGFLGEVILLEEEQGAFGSHTGNPNSASFFL